MQNTDLNISALYFCQDSDTDHIKDSADNPTIVLNSFQLVGKGGKEKSFLFVAFHITLAGFTTYLDKSR